MKQAILLKNFNILEIILFIKYFTSNIILHVEMSIVNLKVIFVKKQKRTRKRPNSRPGRDIHYNRNGRFHTRDGLFV